MISDQKKIAECYQPLFDYFYNEHKIILLNSEMTEIMQLIEQVNKNLILLNGN